MKLDRSVSFGEFNHARVVLPPGSGQLPSVSHILLEGPPCVVQDVLRPGG